jgi:hypothetical protein
MSDFASFQGIGNRRWCSYSASRFSGGESVFDNPRKIGWAQATSL